MSRNNNEIVLIRSSGRFALITEDLEDDAYRIVYLDSNLQILIPTQTAIILDEDIDPYSDPLIDFMMQ